MSESQKKQNFLQGTALLAMATAIVKVIGALYKIPLNAIIGEQGFGYFNTAYEIYAVLLMISTAGLPVAMTMVRGKILYQNGKFPTIDLPAVIEDLTTYALPKLFTEEKK